MAIYGLAIATVHLHRASGLTRRLFAISFEERQCRHRQGDERTSHI